MRRRRPHAWRRRGFIPRQDTPAEVSTPDPATQLDLDPQSPEFWRAVWSRETNGGAL